MTKKLLNCGWKITRYTMDLEFKSWLEDCGEVTSTYSNVNDQSFANKGLRSNYTGGRNRPEKLASDPEKLFKFKRNKHKK